MASKAKHFTGKYEAKFELLGDGGPNQKLCEGWSGRGQWTFSGKNTSVNAARCSAILKSKFNFKS